MRITQRTVASLLLFMMLLTACGTSPAAETESGSGDTSAPTGPEITAETETDPPEYTVPEADYDGASFTIAAIDYYSQGGGSNWIGAGYCEVYSDATGDPLNDAIFERNNVVEEELNVSIEVYSLSSYSNAGKEFRTPLLAGETIIDLGMINGSNLPTVFSAGIVSPINSLPNLDLSHSWWDKKSVEEFTVMDSLYTVTGDMSLGISLSPITYFFSKELVELNSLENPYTLVKEGRWTLDSMMEMAETVIRDTNGNGETDVEEDTFGIMLEPPSMTYAVHASDVSLTGRDEAGAPTIEVNADRVVGVLDKLIPFFNDKNTTILSTRIKGYNNVFFELFLPNFQENRSLFFNNQLLVALNMREMDADFGILPPPKYDEAQTEYCCPVSYWWATFAVLPKTNSRPEMTGHMMEAMGYYSQQLVTPVYIEKTIQGKTLRDEDSIEMLDIILSQRVYEIAAVYNWGNINTMYEKLATKSSSQFASTYASNEKAARTALEKTLADMQG